MPSTVASPGGPRMIVLGIGCILTLPHILGQTSYTMQEMGVFIRTTSSGPADAGDGRFHPDNIIWSSRRANIIAIIERKEGKIVWKVGPDYSASPALRKLGQMIGTHHVTMIPKGLPGEGNILIFDNGGAGGYGAPNPGSRTGLNNAIRDPGS